MNSQIPEDPAELAKLLAASVPPGQEKAFLAALLDRSSGLSAAFLDEEPRPTVRPIPATARGFRLRVDLAGAKPPVWRRVEVRGDLTLDVFHYVIQAAMGWTNSHLHRFRESADHRAAYFVTEWDVAEGEEGILEDTVRLDQVLAEKGDRLFYEYDFGDGWEHVVNVEAVLDEPPAVPRCVAGRLACPPEDCGGIWGYAELADWVRGGYDPANVPQGLSAAEMRGWLPLDWDPDEFSVEEADEAVAAVVAEPIAVGAELGGLLEAFARSDVRVLRDILARPVWRESPDLDVDQAEELTAAYRLLMELIGDGAKLTSAGYLPPAVVEAFAEQSGITSWWIGKANREDITAPVADARSTAQALGLVNVRKGVLSVSAAGRRGLDDPVALWRHIVSRLPVGRGDFERQAGWLTLAVAGGSDLADEWSSEVGTLLSILGWRERVGSREFEPSGNNPTLEVLTIMGGALAERRRLRGPRPAVSATARAAVITG